MAMRRRWRRSFSQSMFQPCIMMQEGEAVTPRKSISIGFGQVSKAFWRMGMYWATGICSSVRLGLAEMMERMVAWMSVSGWKYC